MDKRNILFIILLAASFYLIQFIFPPQKPLVQQKIVTEKKIDTQDSAKQKVYRSTSNDGKEKFYVLENEFQMLVFSTKGGAISEINLPFKSKSNPKSIINSIEFDKEIKEVSKKNATFPLHPYMIYENDKQVDKQEGTIGGYYPLLRRELIGNDNIAKKYYAFNISSDFQDIENANYEVTKFDKDSIEFKLSTPSRTIIKKYTLSNKAPYVIDMDLNVSGENKDLWISSGVLEVELTSGRSDPLLKISEIKKQKNVIEKIKLPKNTTTVENIYPDWVCNSNSFFGIIIDPLNEISNGYRSKQIPGEVLPSRLTLINQRHNAYPAKKYPGYEIFLPLKNLKSNIKFRFFSGPLAKNVLVAIDDVYSNAITGYNPSYVKARSFHGIFAFISEPFAKLMFSIMQMFHKLTSSWGISIILLTLVLRVMLYPLNAWAIKSQGKMQELQPRIQELQNRHAKDPQKLKMEMATLYRQKGANPLLGCFPMFIQMPFFIGMFDLLKTTFELRGASFIPGWINNLTAPDNIFTWDYPIPIIGTGLHLLPIISGLVMFLQTKFTAKKQDVSQMSEKQRQQQAMSSIFPVVFTLIFYSMPSGLNLYFLFSNIFGWIQQWHMNKYIKNKKI
ncbi:MAG: Membrane protein insertase YidC [Candidatus Anoxychlamydiales bacterium]|nr:Membrane protein insertase YidC [Candidatus Anoxychlamydiales bacterium]